MTCIYCREYIHTAPQNPLCGILHRYPRINALAIMVRRGQHPDYEVYRGEKFLYTRLHGPGVSFESVCSEIHPLVWGDPWPGDRSALTPAQIARLAELDRQIEKLAGLFQVPVDERNVPLGHVERAVA